MNAIEEINAISEKEVREKQDPSKEEMNAIEPSNETKASKVGKERKKESMRVRDKL